MKTKIHPLRGLAYDFFYRVLQVPAIGSLLLLSTFILLPILLCLIIGDGIAEQAMFFALIVVSAMFIAEIIFRLGFRFLKGEPYQLIPRLNFNGIYVKPHPYIPFVMKRKFKTEIKGVVNYPLHKGRYSFGQYTTNNMGFTNGYNGDRDVVMPKPEGLLRINCIGASTTGNYIEENGQVFSYPLELEKKLKSMIDFSVEVNNCGQGGYNSADIMVRFALQVVDTRPDIVVIYHAYNDIRAYLTKDFEADYSHVRCNLGDNYWKFALVAHIPYIPIKFINFLINRWLPASIRNSLLEQVTIGDFDMSLDYSAGLSTYRRNLQHIIDICRSNRIKVILSTYCHYLYDEIKTEPLHILYAKIVKEENNVMRDLALMNNITLVDNAKLIPQDERYFVDSIHFTPEGMEKIAENIADAIAMK